MSHRHFFRSLVVLGLLAAALHAEPVCLQQFRSRVTKVTGNLATIELAGDAAAQRVAEHPQAFMAMAMSRRPAFAEEMMGRAGGLANMVALTERRKPTTPDDLALVSVRSWASDGEDVVKQAQRARDAGWMVLLFASAADKPGDMPADVLLDNFATGGGEGEASLNALTNVLNGWLWTCEYYAALTRRGKYPGVLLSVLMDGAREHNAVLQKGDRRFLGDAEQAIPSGQLARAYLDRLQRLLDTMGSAERQAQIDKAAAVVAADLKAGTTVGVASCTHFMPHELALNRRTAIKPFHASWRSEQPFAKHLQPGDLLIWIGYVGMNTSRPDFVDTIRNAGLRLVASHAPDAQDPSNMAKDALAIVQQDWAPPDAEVKIPNPPGFIAPVSGINQGLLMLLLEERVLKLMESAEPGA